jgi:hypothetical protein
MINNRTIFVTFRREGIHCYPGAPEDVKFLRDPHRHIFWFKVTIDVFHNERDLEFIRFKRELENLYSTNTLQLNAKSCETIAEELINYISSKYPKRWIAVEISEDGENGATLDYEPT